jgi:hypothetical protein
MAATSVPVLQGEIQSGLKAVQHMPPMPAQSDMGLSTKVCRPIHGNTCLYHLYRLAQQLAEAARRASQQNGLFEPGSQQRSPTKVCIHKAPSIACPICHQQARIRSADARAGHCTIQHCCKYWAVLPNQVSGEFLSPGKSRSGGEHLPRGRRVLISGHMGCTLHQLVLTSLN